MLIETVQKLIGRKVVWEKLNIANGNPEILTGQLIEAGIGPKVGNVEYAVVEMDNGRQWITLASCVKGVVE